MKILALEFSSGQRSVAVVESGSGKLPAVLGEASDTARRASAMGLVEKVLVTAQTEREEIEVIAVGLGPGSYTGIRAAIAMAQGWRLALSSVKLLGVSSAECLVRQAQNNGWSGKVSVAIDAQRNELYLASYEISAAEIRNIAPLHLVGIEEAKTQTSTDAIVIGPEVKRWFQSGREFFPSAAVLGQIATRRREFISGEKLEPIYLRATSFVKAPPSRSILI